MDGVPSYVEPTDKEKFQQVIIKGAPRVLRFIVGILYELFRLIKDFIRDSISMLRQ